jgi:hypothetical protein
MNDMKVKKLPMIAVIGFDAAEDLIFFSWQDKKYSDPLLRNE